MARRKFDTLQPSAKIIDFKPQSSGVCDNKLFYAARIKELRKAVNMSQYELAEKLGLSRSAILNWETGRTRPDINNIPALCSALHIPVSEFFASHDSVGWNQEELSLLRCYRGLTQPHQKVVMNVALELERAEVASSRKVYPTIQLLQRHYAMESIAAGVNFESFEATCEQCYVHDTPTMRRADILFRVNGESMEPTYADGCTVMVEKTTDLAYGEIGVFSADGSLYIKKYQEDGLYSLNPHFKPMLSKNYTSVQIIGRVIGIAEPTDFATNFEIEVFESQEKEP